jgi:hypothetical protein
MWNYVGEKWQENLTWRARLPRSIQGSFTCSKFATWDPQLYFPSEGRRAANFFFSPWKIRRLRSGLNPWTWVLKASTLPTDHRSRYYVEITITSWICLSMNTLEYFLPYWDKLCPDILLFSLRDFLICLLDEMFCCPCWTFCYHSQSLFL